MSHQAVSAVKRLAIDAIQTAHAPDQIGLRCFQQQVVVVVHKAKGVEPPALLLDFFREQFNKTVAILVIEENRLAAIAAGGDVVDSSGKFETQRAGHACKLRQEAYKVLTPVSPLTPLFPTMQVAYGMTRNSGNR